MTDLIIFFSKVHELQHLILEAEVLAMPYNKIIIIIMTMSVIMGGQILFLFCGKGEGSQTYHGTWEAEPLVKGSLFPGVHPAKQTWVEQEMLPFSPCLEKEKSGKCHLDAVWSMQRAWSSVQCPVPPSTA